MKNTTKTTNVQNSQSKEMNELFAARETAIAANPPSSVNYGIKYGAVAPPAAKREAYMDDLLRYIHIHNHSAERKEDKHFYRLEATMPNPDTVKLIVVTLDYYPSAPDAGINILAAAAHTYFGLQVDWNKAFPSCNVSLKALRNAVEADYNKFGSGDFYPWDTAPRFVKAGNIMNSLLSNTDGDHGLFSSNFYDYIIEAMNWFERSIPHFDTTSYRRTVPEGASFQYYL